VDSVSAMAALYFPSSEPTAVNYCNKPEEFVKIANSADSILPEGLRTKLATTGRTPKADDVKYVFITKVGPGPINVSQEESLLDSASGNPVEPGPKHKRLRMGV
jgi:hypothetical protein